MFPSGKVKAARASASKAKATKKGIFYFDGFVLNGFLFLFGGTVFKNMCIYQTLKNFSALFKIFKLVKTGTRG